MGQHDPLDGFITYTETASTVLNSKASDEILNLDKEINEIKLMCTGMNMNTPDPWALEVFYLMQS